MEASFLMAEQRAFVQVFGAGRASKALHRMEGVEDCCDSEGIVTAKKRPHLVSTIRCERCNASAGILGKQCLRRLSTL